MNTITIESLHERGYLLNEGLGIALAKEFTEDTDYKEGLLCQGLGVVYILKGEADFMVNDNHYHASQNDLISIADGAILSNLMMSIDFRFRMFYVTTELRNALASKLHVSWNVINLPNLHKSHVLHISDEEARNLCLYYDLLDSKRTESRHQLQSIDLLCEAFGYELLDLVYRHVLNQEGDTQQSLSSPDMHFDKFMHLLHETDPLPHQVAWFADQLSITPKYLTGLCQRVIHRTPSFLIEREISQRAVRLLQQSTLSIKQISQELGFTNQSHFGTYLRRTVGKGPQEIRNAKSELLANAQ